MGNTIDLQLNLKTNLQNANAEATKFNKTMESAANNAERISRAGSKPMASAARPASQSAAYKQSMQDTEGGSYGVARGMVGTGAEGRDFSKQAAGLGGLVHVYATFAANLFAVSAAFNALSKAADTTNMVQGLNQLGAASGKNLGSMAKRMTELTDGAISLRTAMEATAQASAAGMSGQQMERMTVVAKKAAQALGRDMTDAMSRLSRGITKMEPELLDELGIFTRVDKASQEYARSVGKTAASLTDFEKRQAFATAAIAEAEKKFNAIELDANPYDKLLASFMNLAQAGGELMNKVLGPIAKILSESPTALGVAMAGIATMLLSKAIPALSQWKQGLVEAADIAEKKAKIISESLTSYKINKGLDVEKGHLSAADTAREQALQLAESEKLFGKTSKTMYALAGGTKDLGIAATATKAKITGLDSALVQENNKLLALNASQTEEREIAKAKIKVLEDNRQKYVQLAATIAVYTDEMEKANAAGLAEESKNPGLEERIRQTNADKATNKAARARISSNVVSNTEMYGAGYAWKQISKDIEEHNEKVGKGTASIGLFGSSYLKASGAIKIATTSLLSAVNAFSGWLAIIGMVVTAFQFLNSALTGNAKETEKFNSSIDVLNSSIDGMDRTLSTISKKDPLEAISPESIQAKANAFNELSTGVESLVDNLEKSKEKMTGSDKFWDNVFGFFGKGVDDKAVKSMSLALESTVKSVNTNKIGQNLKIKLEETLKTTDFSAKGIEKALDGLSEAERDAKLKELEGILKEVNIEMNNSASKLTALQNTFTDVGKTLESTINSLRPNDNMSKLAIGYMQIGEQLQNLNNDVEESFSAFSKLANSFDQLKTLPASAATAILNYRGEINSLTNSMKVNKDALELQKKSLLEQQALLDKINITKESGGKLSAAEEEAKKVIEDRIASIKMAIDISVNDIKIDDSKMESLNTKLQEDTKGIFDKGIESLDVQLNSTMKKAALGFQQSVAGVIGGTLGIEIDAAAQQEMLKIDRQLIDSQFNLAISTERLRLSNEKIALEDKQTQLQKSGDIIGAGKLQSAIFDLENAIDLLSGNSGSGMVNAIEAAVKGSEDMKKHLGGAYQLVVGMKSKFAELGIKSLSIEFQKQLKTQSEAIKQGQEVIIYQEKELSLRKQVTDSLASTMPYYSASLNSIQQSNIESAKDLEIQKVSLKYADEIGKLLIARQHTARKAEVDRMIAEKQSQLESEKNLITLKSRLEVDKLLLDSMKKRIDSVKEEIEHQKALLSISNEIADQIDTSIKAKIEAAKTLGAITTTQSIEANTTIEAEKLTRERDTQLKLAEIDVELKRASLAISERQTEIYLKQLEIQNQSNKDEASKLEITKYIQSTRTEMNAEHTRAEERINELYNAQKNKIESIYNLKQKDLELQKELNIFMEKYGSTIKAVEDTLSQALKLGMEKSSKEGWKKFFDDFKTRAKDLVFDVVMKPQVEAMKNAFISILPGGKELLDKARSIPEKQVARLDDININTKTQVDKLEEITKSTNDTIDTINSGNDINRDGFKNMIGACKDLSNSLLNQSTKQSNDVKDSFDRLTDNLPGDIAAAQAEDSSIHSYRDDTGYGDTGAAIYDALSDPADSIATGGTGVAYGGASILKGASTLWASVKSFGSSVWGLVSGIGSVLTGGKSSSASSSFLSKLSGVNLSGGNAFADFALSSTGQQLGLSTVSASSPEAFLNGAPNMLPADLTASGQFVADLAPYAGSIMQLVQGDVAGAAVNAGVTYLTTPFLGPFAPLAGSFVSGLLGSGGGPKTEGGKVLTLGSGTGNFNELSSTGQKFFTGDNADSLVEGILGPDFENYVEGMVTRYKGNYSGIELGLGFNSDPQGTASDSVASGVYKDGKQVYLHNQQGGRGNYTQLLDDELPRLTLAAIKASEPIAWVADILDTIDLNTATKEQVDSIITMITNMERVIPLFSAIGIGSEEISTNLITLMGGFDAAASSLSNYYNAFYSQGEKNSLTMSNLRQGFEDLNIEMPSTKDGFRTLVESLDVTTESGQQTFAALMALSPAFAAIMDAAEATWNAFQEKFIDPANKSSSTLSRAKDTINEAFGGEFGASIKALGLELPTTREGFGQLGQTLKDMGVAGEELYNTTMELAPAFDTLASAQESIIDTVAQISNRIADMKFGFEYDTKDEAGKYKMLQGKADTQMSYLEENIATLSMSEAATKINELLDTTNSAFSLLSEEQKKAALPQYLQTLDDIDAMIKAKGIDELVKLTPDGVGIVDAVNTSAQLIVDAIVALSDVNKDSSTQATRLAESESIKTNMPTVISESIKEFNDLLSGWITVGPVDGKVDLIEENLLNLQSKLPTTILDSVNFMESIKESLADWKDGGFENPAAEAAREKEREALQQLVEKDRGVSEVAEAQAKTNEAIQGLTSGTSNLASVAAALGSLITSLASVDRTINVSVSAPAGSEVAVH